MLDNVIKLLMITQWISLIYVTIIFLHEFFYHMTVCKSITPVKIRLFLICKQNICTWEHGEVYSKFSSNHML